MQKYPKVFLRVMCGDGKEKLLEVEVAYGVAAPREAGREGRGATGEVSEVRRVSRSQLAPSWLARSLARSVCADDSAPAMPS